MEKIAVFDIICETHVTVGKTKLIHQKLFVLEEGKT